MTGQYSDPGPGVAHLCQQAHELVAGVTGPLLRLCLRTGDAVLEIEWAVPVVDAPSDRYGSDRYPPDPGQGNGVTPSGPLRAGSAAVAPQGGAGDPDRTVVAAPMVGTFYRAPEPGGQPFVDVGDLVEAGQVVGIVEAMKLMNHVTTDRAGRVIEVLATDGAPVEFEQPLIALVPR